METTPKSKFTLTGCWEVDACEGWIVEESLPWMSTYLVNGFLGLSDGEARPTTDDAVFLELIEVDEATDSFDRCICHTCEPTQRVSE